MILNVTERHDIERSSAVVKEFVLYSSVCKEIGASEQSVANMCEHRPIGYGQRHVCIGRDAIDANAMRIAQM